MIIHLHVQVEYVLSVHELNPFANLSHEYCAASLRQQKIIIDHTLEQFTTLNSAIIVNIALKN